LRSEANGACHLAARAEVGLRVNVLVFRTLVIHVRSAASSTARIAATRDVLSSTAGRPLRPGWRPVDLAQTLVVSSLWRWGRRAAYAVVLVLVTLIVGGAFLNGRRSFSWAIPTAARWR
jgi:hypothetical protein